MRRPWALVYLLGTALLFLSVAACSKPPSPTPTSTATPVVTSTLTPSPTPSATPSPTATQRPTATPTRKPSSLWQEALRLSMDGDCAHAIPLLEKAAAILPPRDTANARYRLGACLALTGDWDGAVQAWKSVPADSKWHPPALFLTGEALLRSGRPSEARDAFSAYLESAHAITDVVLSRIATAYVAEGEMGKAEEAWAGAVAAAPDPYTRVTLREEEIEALKDAGLYEKAAAQYEAILSDARNERYRTEVWRRLGDVLEKAGETKEAVKAWLHAIQGDETSFHAYAALIELVKRQVPVDDYRRGIIDYAHGAYGPAAEALSRYVASGKEAHADDARIHLALAHGALGRMDSAREALEPLLASPHSSARFRKGMQALADAYLNGGRWRDAHETLLELSEKATSTETKADALWQAGKIALEHRDYLLASGDISRLVKEFPDSAVAPKGLFVIGLGAYRFGLHSAAVAALQMLRDRYPDFDPERVHFWLGQAAAKDHRPDLAKEEWSAISSGYGYYPTMARQQGAALGIPLPAPDPPDANCGDSSLPDPPAPDGWWRRGVALLRVGLREEAYRSFRRATSDYRDDPQACAGAAAALASLGEYRVSVGCARHALATWDGPPPCALYRLAYPAYYADLISTEARVRGVDPFLVLALVRQESHFSTYAGSTAGAQGLMQLMPATARWIASRIGTADPTGKLSSPALNVGLGTAFLKMNLDAFDDLKVEALAAYNAGYNRMVRWRKIYGDDEALLAEAIPIEETRDYVRLVLAQEDLYRRLYRGAFPTPPPCSGDEGLLPLVEEAR